MNKKKIAIFWNTLLLIWFLLDMTGFCINGHCLVIRSYKEDGIFYLIYLTVYILFIFRVEIGKWLLSIWLAIWLLFQLLAHEWYSIFDSGFMGNVEGKIRYFSETIKLFEIEGKYIPDLYHIVLHLLIAFALISTIRFIRSKS